MAGPAEVAAKFGVLATQAAVLRSHLADLQQRVALVQDADAETLALAVASASATAACCQVLEARALAAAEGKT